LIGSYLAQEGAICRIVDGFIFEAVGRRRPGGQAMVDSAAMSAYGT
jgi:hypothetical protein